MELDEHFIEDIKTLKQDIVKAEGYLWNFMDNAERETLVAQTVSAAEVNLREQGEPFSIRGPGCLQGWQRCGTNNRAGYEYLINNGYFVEEQRVVDGEDTVVIFPTRKLLDKLKKHFKR